jgi:DNA-directed RNA polymerase subunit M/transcription elongation factor TFIIS
LLLLIITYNLEVVISKKKTSNINFDNPNLNVKILKCSFCKNALLYVNKLERNTDQQMILYRCKDCKIRYKEFILDSKIEKKVI